MNITNMKNIIVLKNLPSNLVEEAIVVLKSNKKIKNHEFIEKKGESGKKEIGNSEDYIIREAEMIVSNFITAVEKPIKKPKTSSQLEKKYKRLKIITIALGTLTLINMITNLI